MTSLAECTTDSGTLTLGGLSMHTAAWGILDSLRPLYLPVDFRGENDLLPGVAGRQENPVYVDETTHQLRMVIVGHLNPAGVVYPDPDVGLDTNIGLLRAVTDPPVSSTSTRTASLVLRSGAVVAGPVQPLGLRLGEAQRGTDAVSGLPGIVQRATLVLRIPAGLLS